MSDKMIELESKGFKKVDMECHGSFISAIYFNSTLEDVKSVVCSDCEWDLRDDWDMYDAPIDQIALKAYKIFLAKKRIGKEEYDAAYYAEIGDELQVIKGRKTPIGTKGIVTSLWKFKDKYGRYCCTYARLLDGSKVIVDNCKISNARELMV